jgi:hypothetical protein
VIPATSAARWVDGRRPVFGRLLFDPGFADYVDSSQIQLQSDDRFWFDIPLLGGGALAMRSTSKPRPSDFRSSQRTSSSRPSCCRRRELGCWT